MKNSSSSNKNPLWIGLLVLAIAGAVLTKGSWYPLETSDGPTSILDKLDQHAQEKSHDHEQHGAGNVIALSERGLKNIGFEPFVVEPMDYQRMLTLPAIVVESPGRSQLHLSTPLTGTVTKINAITGEAVDPDRLIFKVQLTHEDLVEAQREYLRNVENLEVVNREIKRLRSLGEGVIAGRRILEQEYEQQKLMASLHAEAQAMLLHGLAQAQVDEIRRTRRLFQEIEIRTPDHDNHDQGCASEHPYQVQKLNVAQGQQVEAGSPLAVLGDHCELLIEAMAFEDDALAIRQASEANREIVARRLSGSSQDAPVTGLEVLYVADQIDADSRAFKVYLRLPNKLAADKTSTSGKRFVEWLYKPGQRMQVQVPVETWENQLVLPATAVVDEGAEAYVYHQHGDHFDRVAVHVLHRDRDEIVVASDGALKFGNVIAGKGAYQIHLSLKNQAGGGADPHAGHNH